MPNSYAQTIELTCPETQQSFKFDLWLIIDCDERPDLIEKVIDKSIHVAPSPYADCAITLEDAPLLVFQPQNEPPLFFSPSQQPPTTELMQQQASSLISRLKNNLADNWQEGWLDNSSLTNISRDSIQAALTALPSQSSVDDEPEVYSEEEIEKTSRQLLQSSDFFAEMNNIKNNKPKLFAQMKTISAREKPKRPPELDPLLRQIREPYHSKTEIPHLIECCHKAIVLVDHTLDGRLWSAIQAQLGNFLVQTPAGSRADNHEAAIAAYEAALTVRTKDALPTLWATTMHNMGSAFSNRIRGDKAANIEKAISIYQQVFTVRTKETMPYDWAISMMNLANVYRKRIKGDKAQNIELTIETNQEALSVITKDDMPDDWAQIMSNLGNAYYSRIDGNRADNVDKAIELYRGALTVRTKDDQPHEWASTTNSLATAYSARVYGSLRENIETAIEMYRDALIVRTKDDLPYEWATTMMNLAATYVTRIEGEPADNIDFAIEIYQDVLTVYTEDDMPVDWANTLHNLGLALYDQVSGNKSENIEKAIEVYQAALSVRTKDTLPLEWATTMNSLGLAYAARQAGEKANNIEKAIEVYQAALSVRTKDTLPHEWAATTTNLANAYAIRIKGDKAENIEKAIETYEKTLAVYTQEGLPHDWADTLNNLASAFTKRINGDKATNIQQAIAYYEQVLVTKTRNNSPIEHRNILTNIINLYFREHHWEQAYRYSLEAIDIGDDIFAEAYTDAGRQSAVAESWRFYTRAAYSALKLGHLDEALSLLEAGKARLLSDALALNDYHLANINDADRAQLESLRQQIRDLEYESRLPSLHPLRRDTRTINNRLNDQRSKLREHIDAINARNPQSISTNLSSSEIKALIPADSALVAPMFTTEGSAIFVVPHKTQSITKENIIMLDAYTVTDLYTLTRQTENAKGWLGYYFDYRLGNINFRTMLDGLDDITQQLWETLGKYIHEKLFMFSVSNILFMPHRDINLLPLHAAWHVVDDIRHYFIDDYTVSYVTSMFSYANAQQKTRQGDGVFVAGVSEYTNMPNLPNAQIEAQQIASLFQTQCIENSAATIEAVTTGIVNKSYIHLACHGGFGWNNDIFNSVLYLGDDEVITLSEIMARFDLETAQLVVLSACETGIIDVTHTPEETLGFRAGLLQTGASAVISSLWTIDDRSTSLLMEKMYGALLKDSETMNAAHALRNAQRWLRDVTAKELTDYYQTHITPRMAPSDASSALIDLLMHHQPEDRPYAHPYFWGAFAFSGLITG